MVNPTAIIQARMGSTRHPGKTLVKIGTKTLIERVIDRVLTSKTIKNIILATTVLSEDDKLAEFIKNKYPQVNIYRGDKDDVLQRFIKAARLFHADPIIRITADDPFKDPFIIDNLLDVFLDGKYDYVSNTIKHTYPEGLDIEVFSLNALVRADKEGRDQKDREHVTYYIWNHPEIFKLKNIEADKNYSGVRLTVDYQEDLDLAEKIYNHFAPREDFYFQDIMDLLKAQPELVKINQNIERYESLKK